MSFDPPLPLTSSFSYSAATAPEYDLLIPANVHLSLMRQRALNLHYRQPQACLADARTIFLNALYYNGALSPIALRVSKAQLTAVISVLCTQQKSPL